MPDLSDAELMVLAWPTDGQPPEPIPLAQVSVQHHGRTAEFGQQIDWLGVRQEIGQLQQEIARQRRDIAAIRRQLPRGWYRRITPTVDLEIQAGASVAVPTVELPIFRQLLEFWQVSSRKPSNPR